AGALERAARLVLEAVVAAVAVFVDPFADGVALVARLSILGPVAPVAPVREDAADFVADQDVGGLRRDDVFLDRQRHQARHAAREASRGRVIAKAALGL